MTGITVTADDAAGWTVQLADDGSRLDLRLDDLRWTIDEGRDGSAPTAVSGGWTDPDTLTVDVAFLETPHHLVVTCSLASHTFEARWRTMPLGHSPLRSLRAPRLPG